MTSDEVKQCTSIINDLWPMTAKEPDKGGWSGRMTHEVRERLKPFAFDVTEAILSAMRFEKASQMRPAVDDLFARLRTVSDSNRRRAHPHEQASDDGVERRSFAHWKRWHDDPERFDACVAAMNAHEPSSGDDYAAGARLRWGDQYGRQRA